MDVDAQRECLKEFLKGLSQHEQKTTYMYVDWYCGFCLYRISNSNSYILYQSVRLWAVDSTFIEYCFSNYRPNLYAKRQEEKR